jgi:hypothetical protein
MLKLIDLDPANYQPHRLHTQERDWAETNCYVDIWIELLNAMGHEPLAALPFTLSIDFEGDQWTFFKFPLADLYELYGLDVQEMAAWRPLTAHIEEQLKGNKPVLVELDSFHLPDTEGSAYKIAHVKSTVAITHFDAGNHRMGYFHGQGYYELERQNFRDVFYLDSNDPARLPPYVEIVKSRKGKKLGQSQLVDASLNLLKKQLRMIPEKNPFNDFIPRFQQDLEGLMEANLDVFHQYSFATFRQFGACYELAANYLGWLSENNISNLSKAQQSIKSISELSKVYQFQLARAMSRKRELDLSPVTQMSEHWETAMDQLTRRIK